MFIPDTSVITMNVFKEPPVSFYRFDDESYFMRALRRVAYHIDTSPLYNYTWVSYPIFTYLHPRTNQLRLTFTSSPGNDIYTPHPIPLVVCSSHLGARNIHISRVLWLVHTGTDFVDRPYPVVRSSGSRGFHDYVTWVCSLSTNRCYALCQVHGTVGAKISYSCYG